MSYIGAAGQDDVRPVLSDHLTGHLDPKGNVRFSPVISFLPLRKDNHGAPAPWPHYAFFALNLLVSMEYFSTLYWMMRLVVPRSRAAWL